MHLSAAEALLAASNSTLLAAPDAAVGTPTVSPQLRLPLKPIRLGMATLQRHTGGGSGANSSGQSSPPSTRPKLAWGNVRETRKMVGRMGPWQLVRQLGDGPLTRVYLARPLEIPEAAPTYAVKALRKEWWHDPAAIELMRREASVGRQVSHPHVVPVLSAQVTQPPFYLVMPRLAGETVAEKLASDRLPPLPQSLWIARQAAEALGAMHEQAGMIHGDIKPSNLHVAPDGHTTLIDLGFSQSATEARSWAGRPVMGTLHYLAPERITSACCADIRSDLYGLGVTLYQMLTGLLPFEAEEPADLIAMHRQAKPQCLRDARPDVPKRVASMVHRLLAKDPMRRPESPRAVSDELVRLEIESFAA